MAKYFLLILDLVSRPDPGAVDPIANWLCCRASDHATLCRKVASKNLGSESCVYCYLAGGYANVIVPCIGIATLKLC